MIEMINRLCELSAEVGKAQMLFEQREETDKQNKELFEQMQAELERRQDFIETLKQQNRQYRLMAEKNGTESLPEPAEPMVGGPSTPPF